MPNFYDQYGEAPEPGDPGYGGGNMAGAYGGNMGGGGAYGGGYDQYGEAPEPGDPGYGGGGGGNMFNAPPQQQAPPWQGAEPGGFAGNQMGGGNSWAMGLGGQPQAGPVGQPQQFGGYDPQSFGPNNYAQMEQQTQQSFMQPQQGGPNWAQAVMQSPQFQQQYGKLMQSPFGAGIQKGMGAVLGAQNASRFGPASSMFGSPNSRGGGNVFGGLGGAFGSVGGGIGSMFGFGGKKKPQQFGGTFAQMMPQQPGGGGMESFNPSAMHAGNPDPNQPQ